eukprot:Anaeramoba_flamelloidesa1059904_16.p1 GENE.a1059904_16~~a1059904_16.p1  ORF type:complete len:140 (-),score=23.88 a1059904_16:130-549(-)
MKKLKQIKEMSKQPTNGKNHSAWLTSEVSLQEIKSYTRQEVKKHKDDNWVIYKNKVYDLTPYMKHHPGGQETILPYLGKDITRTVKSVHGWVNVEKLVKKCHIGNITLTLNIENIEKTSKDEKSKPLTPSRLRFQEFEK